MATAQQKKSLRQKLAGLASILAFVAAYVAFGPIGRPYLERLTRTDADIRADIEKTFSDFKLYQALKKFYPADYESMVASTVQDVRKRTSTKDATVRGADFTANLRRREAPQYAKASIESLRLNLRTQIPILNYLKTSYGFRACNEMAVNGGPSLIRMIGEKFMKDTTLMKLTDEASSYYFETTAEGKRLQLAHDQPTDADWQEVAAYITSRGMTQSDLEIFAESTKHMDESKLCDVAIQFLDGVTTMGNDAAKRIIPYIASTTAAL